MKLTTLKNNPRILIENCCSGANVFTTYNEWGIQRADGVRRWNRGALLSCECVVCGKELHFEEGEP